MTTPTAYAAIRDKKNELIRKGLDGSVFAAPFSSDPITTLTISQAGPPVVIGLAPLPVGYGDVGWLTTDGANLAEAVTTSVTSSWGSVEPTRDDITAETTTLVFTAQETKALTVGLYTSVDTATITPDATTGEVSIEKPITPSVKYWRMLVLGVDKSDAGEIYVARFLPKSKVTDKTDQKVSLDDNGVTWGVTMTAFEDSALGYSEKFYFGGPGWQALVAELGFGV